MVLVQHVLKKIFIGYRIVIVEKSSFSHCEIVPDSRKDGNVTGFRPQSW